MDPIKKPVAEPPKAPVPPVKAQPDQKMPHEAPKVGVVEPKPKA